MINKLFNALSKSRSRFGQIFNSKLGENLSYLDFDEIEEKLIETDMGYDAVDSILALIKSDTSSGSLRVLNAHLVNLLPSQTNLKIIDNMTVLLIFGVNGSGKTTTAAKLSHYYKSLGYKITLVAADTYRAAAVEQLRIWSERVGCDLICNEETADPSSVIFNGMESAKAQGNSLVIIDTAGRLHTSSNLMLELKKMNNVIDNRFPEFSKFSLITIDASLGQNSLSQAKEFNKYCNINGAVLTKLDGTAKGGIIFALYNELKIPVNFIGFGESLEDLEIFEPMKYVNSILSDN